VKYELVFVSTPYSKIPDHNVAAAQAAKICAYLIQYGFHPYSPIIHSHEICRHGGLDPLAHEFWLRQNEAFMERSDALIVAKMAGWSESVGVQYEIDWFRARGKPVHFVEWPQSEDIAA
jgi:hypothetical protein